MSAVVFSSMTLSLFSDKINREHYLVLVLKKRRFR